MLINGMPFTVSNIRYGSLRRLRTAAGNCTLLSQFRPVRYPHSTHIWRLLYNGFFVMVYAVFLQGRLFYSWRVYSIRLLTPHYL